MNAEIIATGSNNLRQQSVAQAERGSSSSQPHHNQRMRLKEETVTRAGGIEDEDGRGEATRESTQQTFPGNKQNRKAAESGSREEAAEKKQQQ